MTGGALGLGRATAERIVKQGGQVCIFDFSEAGEAVAKELGASAIFQQGDVRDPAAVQHAIDATLTAFQRLDAAVSCAAFAKTARETDRNATLGLRASGSATTLGSTSGGSIDASGTSRGANARAAARR